MSRVDKKIILKQNSTNFGKHNLVLNMRQKSCNWKCLGERNGRTDGWLESNPGNPRKEKVTRLPKLLHFPCPWLWKPLRNCHCLVLHRARTWHWKWLHPPVQRSCAQRVHRKLEKTQDIPDNQTDNNHLLQHSPAKIKNELMTSYLQIRCQLSISWTKQ